MSDPFIAMLLLFLFCETRRYIALFPIYDISHSGLQRRGISNIVNEVIAKPSLFKSKAIFITFDEGGSYYDSGYVQPLSFFGDGPRVPLMVVSPYAKRGYVDHTYYDHVSILKFIEMGPVPSVGAQSG
jgi:phospholipase C